MNYGVPYISFTSLILMVQDQQNTRNVCAKKTIFDAMHAVYNAIECIHSIKKGGLYHCDECGSYPLSLLATSNSSLHDDVLLCVETYSLMHAFASRVH